MKESHKSKQRTEIAFPEGKASQTSLANIKINGQASRDGKE